MKTGVLIPAHNEAKEIGRIVAAVRAKGLDVVVVDDGSADGSGAIARDNGAIVLTNPVRQGKGASLKKGFQYFKEYGYDAVITMDGDGQHDVDDIDHFFDRAAGEPQSVVNGSRMGNASGMPLVRCLTNRLMSWIISLLCRQSISDTQCGYRYIGCDVLRKINLTSNDFEIETEMLMKASKLGYKIFSVPIKTIYRDEKSKIQPVEDTIRFFKYLFREIRQG